MKKTTHIALFVLGFCLLAFSSCDKGTVTPEPEPEPQAMKVAFANLSADGSATKQTTQLTLTFDQQIEGLTVSDLKFDAKGTGAKMGALTAGQGGTYTLVLTEVSQTGAVTMTVTRKGYDIAPNERKVNVYPSPVTPPVGTISVAFDGLVADGSATETTTRLTFAFSPMVEGLRTEDFTVIAGTTGAQKGAFQLTEAGECVLTLTGISASGEVQIQVAREGYAFSPNSKSVPVFYRQPDGSAPFLNPALVAAIESGNNIHFFKNSDGQVSVPSNHALIQSVSTLDVTEQSLTSLDGIEHFTELTELYCGRNDFTAIEFPALAKLEYIQCNSNKQPWTKFDVSMLTGLKALHCQYNKITELDLTGLANITSLICSDNELTVLNITGLTKLTHLICYNNRLTALDITQIAQFALTHMFSVGSQKDAQGVAQDLSLKVTNDQFSLIFGSSWKDDTLNKGIKLTAIQ